MEPRKLSKEPNDYFSDEEIAEAKERFPKSDRIHKLIARLEAAENALSYMAVDHEKFIPAFEAIQVWRIAAGK
jgi:hypothetical protein